MKPSIAIALVAGLLALPAFGQGSAVIIKNRAKETVNQNNVRQGVPSPAQTPPPPTPRPAPPTATVPAVSPAEGIAKIRASLINFKTGGVATAEQKQQLLKDLAVSARTSKPSLPTTKKLVDSLVGGLSEAVLTPEQQGRLAQNLESVLNSKPLPVSQYDAIIADVQAILQVGGVKRAAAAGIANDLKAVGAEVRR